jgi:hypothetical protein
MGSDFVPLQQSASVLFAAVIMITVFFNAWVVSARQPIALPFP